MLMNDRQIREHCDGVFPRTIRKTSKHAYGSYDDCYGGIKEPMIAPFAEGCNDPNVISYGLTHVGYDLRLGTKLLLSRNTWCESIDPKRFKTCDHNNYRRKMFDEVDASSSKVFLLPPHSYALASSQERLCLPRWVKGRCMGKSTYARCGLIVNTTPLEPGWKGHLTIEIANVTPAPIVLYVGEGIAQVEFELIEEPSEDYAGKGGKYQNQGDEPVAPRMPSYTTDPRD